MSGPARSGLVIYAKDLAHLAQFYTQILNMHFVHQSSELVVLDSADLQIVLHAIPAEIAQRIEISQPPQRRENVAMKFFASVASLAAAQELVQQLGGEVFADAWEGPGFRVRNAMDPEGNVFQLREPTDSAAF